MYQKFVFVGLAAGLSSCAVSGGGDRWVNERNALMREDLVWTQRPRTAHSGELVPTSASSGRGPLATSSSSGAEASFFVDRSVTADEVSDFYLDLAAKQGLKNIVFACGEKDEARYITAAKWTGKYGYVVDWIWYHADPDWKPGMPGGKPHLEDPVRVEIRLTGSKNMYRGTDEDPIADCPAYPLERMARVLRPYGITPFKPELFLPESPDGYWPVYRPLGGRDTRQKRKMPPHVTARFAPSPTSSPSRS
jgi:hypothetical protein